MTRAMTPERLAELQAAAEKATPGPWWCTGEAILAGDGPLGGLLAWTWASYDNDPEGDHHHATLMAAAPEMLAEIVRLNEEIARLREHRKSLNGLYEETIERLQAANADLWERVKRWEPGADPTTYGIGSTDAPDRN